MPKIKALQKGKTFRYNLNRKRVDNKIRSVGTIQWYAIMWRAFSLEPGETKPNLSIHSKRVFYSPEIRKAWNDRRTMTGNLQDMGLAKDVNQVFGIPTAKEQRLGVVKKAYGFIETDVADGVIDTTSSRSSTARPGSSNTKKAHKQHVVDQLEEDANALRESGFRLPKGVVASASYMLEKYGLNYAAMVRDPKNYDQETWRQFRSKIRKFMNIPDQFGAYLVKNNIDIEALDLDEYCSDDE